MLDDDAAVGTCQLLSVLLVLAEPRAETLQPVSDVYYSAAVPAASYRVAVRVAACYRVGLVEQTVADLAREV